MNITKINLHNLTFDYKFGIINRHQKQIAERVEKMGKRKVPQPYIPENLEYLAKNLVDIRDLREKGRRSNID